MTGCTIADFFALADQLPEVTRTDNGTSLWRAYRTIDGEFPNFQMTRIAKPADIYPVFRKLFARQPAARKPRK